MKFQRLNIRRMRARPVHLPMTFALGTSAATVRTAPILLFDLETHEGITGHAYQFCYRPAAAPAIMHLLDDMCDALKDQVVSPAGFWSALSKRHTLIGVEGIVRMAMSLVDVACWDALAKAAEMSLTRFLGASPRPVPAYNSNGLGLMPSPALADEAEKLLDKGFRAVKVRLGYPTLQEDVSAVRAVRTRLPDGTRIMVDYNQALSVDDAVERGRALDAEGVFWIEEPVRHDDFSGCARVASAVETPIQIGENFSQIYDMGKALDAHACDYVMPDLERIGGITGWQQAAALAAEHTIPMSSHLYPEVSAHLLAATPTAQWLEYVDWMNPVLVEPLKIVDGMAVASELPGCGLDWHAEMVSRYTVAV